MSKVSKVSIDGRARAAQMDTVWDKSRPFVWAVGGHVIVLSLLCLDWSLAPAMRAPVNAETGSIAAVEATLVTAPSLSESTPVKSPPAPPSTPPLPPDFQQRSTPHDTLDHEVDQSDKDQIVDPSPLQASNDVRRQASPDRVQPPNDAESPLADEPQPATEIAGDPYAEMRRQRAEAERQHQIYEMNLERVHDQQTATASSNVPQIPPAPPSPFVESREVATWFVGPQPSAITSDFNGNWTFSRELPSTRCPFRDFQSPNDESVTDAWIDCLMNPADGGTANEATWLIEQ